LTQQSPQASPEQPEHPEKPAEPEESSQQAQQAQQAQPAAPEQTAAAVPPAEPELPDLPELPDQPVPAPPPPPASPAQPARKGRIGLIVALVAVVVVGLAVAGVWLVVNLIEEDVPTVGDCLTDQPDPDDMEIVGCDSGEAFWSVIGNDGSWTRGDFDTAEPGELCEEFEATERALWVTSARSVDAGTGGEVVCLAPLDADPPDGTTDE
jgi:hypothetical protein